MLVAGYVVSYIDRTNVALAKLTMAADLPGFDNAVFGLGAGAFFLGFVLLEVPGTVLVERWSARRFLALIMAVWGLVASATALVRTPGHFYAARFVLGLAEGSFFPGVVVYLTHWFPARDRTRALGVFVLGSPLSQVLSPRVGGWLLALSPHEGWRWLFALSGAPAVALAVALPWLLPDRPSQARWLDDDERRALLDVLAAERGAPAGHVSLAQALGNPRVLLIAAAHFCAITCFYGVEFFLPSVLARWYGLPLTTLTWLMSLAAAVSLAAVMAVSWSSDRTRERRLHAALPLLVAGLAVVATPASQHHLAMTAALFALAVAGVKAYLPAFWALPSLFLTGTAAAGSIGFINSVGNLGGFLGPYVIGKVEVMTGSFVAGLVFVGAAAVAAAGLLLALRRA